MTTDAECRWGGPTKPNRNCTVPGDDGYAVQCVGPWIETKHDYLVRYLEATSAVRAKYLTPGQHRPAGGAAFIDLFAGPGRARIRTTGAIVSGSPLLALNTTAAPFTKVILADLDEENIAALRHRTEADVDRTHIVPGDCNATIADISSEIPSYGLNIALIDPWGLQALSFATLSRLAAFKRMDLIIHFPTSDIQRNFRTCGPYLTGFLGTDRWRACVKTARDLGRLIDILREQFGQFGYRQDAVRALPVMNTRRRTLYHLVYATKHPRGNAIWQSVARIDAGGQRSLGI